MPFNKCDGKLFNRYIKKPRKGQIRVRNGIYEIITMLIETVIIKIKIINKIKNQK